MRKPITLHNRRDSASLLDWLDTRQNYERKPPRASKAAFSLGRMRRLLEVLDNPHHAFPVVHVAGTKGKGSTVAMLAAILDTAGYRTGRYMSPMSIPSGNASASAASRSCRRNSRQPVRSCDRRSIGSINWLIAVTGNVLPGSRLSRQWRSSTLPRPVWTSPFWRRGSGAGSMPQTSHGRSSR